jgi:hypothetical protein
VRDAAVEGLTSPVTVESRGNCGALVAFVVQSITVMHIERGSS